MNKNLHEVDKLFREALDNHKEPAPPGAWQGIDADLDRRQVNLFREKYYRLRRIMIVGMAAAALIIAVFITKRTLDKPGATLQGITKENQPSPASSKAAGGQADPQGTPSVQPDANSLATGSAQPAETKSSGAAGSNGQAGSSITDFSLLHGVASNPQDQLHASGAGRLNSPGYVAARNGSFGELQPTRKSNGLSSAGAGQTLPDNWQDEGSVSNKSAGSYSAGGANAVEGKTEAGEKSLYPYFAAFIPYTSPNTSASLGSSAAPGISMPKSNVRQTRIPRFSIAAFGSPNYSYTSLKNNDAVQSSARQKRIFENEEKTSTSYTLGLLVGYALDRHFSIQTGIEYSHTRTDIAPKIIYVRRDNFGRARYEFNCSAGSSFMDPKTAPAPPSVGDSVKVGGSSLEVGYIGVPVLLNYRIAMNRFGLEPTVGFTFNFLHRGESSTCFVTMPGTPKEREVVWGLKTMYVDAAMGLGASYQFNKRVSVAVKPQLRLAMSSTNENMPVKTYQNYFSVESGLRFNL